MGALPKSKNYLIKMSEITSVIATSSLIHPREIFRESIRNGSTAIIVVHNHPSGDPSPSKADLLVAQKLLKSSEIVGFELIDFIILGDARHDPMELGYCSFRDRRLIGWFNQLLEHAIKHSWVCFALSRLHNGSL